MMGRKNDFHQFNPRRNMRGQDGLSRVQSTQFLQILETLLSLK